MKPTLYVPAAIVLSACASGESVDTHTLRALNTPLSRDGSVAIQIPINGRFGEIVYEESGQKVAAAFESEFDQHAPSTGLLGVCERKACIKKAGEADADYFVALEIVHWEERQTAWSARRDQITIKVEVFDVINGTELTSAYLQGGSTLNTLGGDHVEDLLPAIVPRYVSSLY